MVSEQVVEQDDSQLVAGHHSPHTARVGGGHGKSVGVGVGGQDKDLSILIGGGDCRREDLRAFGVGQLIGHRGEVPVGIGLRLEQLDADETGLVEHRQNRNGSDPAKRSVEGRKGGWVVCLEIRSRLPRCEDGPAVRLVDFGTEPGDVAVGDGLVVVHRGDFG